MTKYNPSDIKVLLNGKEISSLPEVPTIKPTEEQLAHSSFVKYTAYVIKALGRELADKEYAKVLEFYINSVPVADAVKKLEKK